MEIELRKACNRILVGLTVVAGIAGIYTADQSIRILCLIGLGVVFLAALGVSCCCLARRHNSIPLDWTKGIKEPPCNLQLVSAAPEDVPSIADLEKNAYNATDAIPESKLREWYSANPHGFLLLMCNDELIGHIDVLPVHVGDPEFQRFRDGRICERDMPGSSLAGPGEKDFVRAIYIESVIIAPPRRIAAMKSAAPLKFLLASTIPIMEKMAVCRNVEYLYAIAASKSGRNLLEALGFRVISRAQDRTDGHNLYAVHPGDMGTRIARFLGPGSVRESRKFEALLRASAKNGL